MIITIFPSTNVDTMQSLIKKYRTDNGLSLGKLGELSGVSKQTIANIEKGANKEHLERLDRLFNALGYSISITPVTRPATRHNIEEPEEDTFVETVTIVYDIDL